MKFSSKAGDWLILELFEFPAKIRLELGNVADFMAASGSPQGTNMGWICSNRVSIPE